jgi:small GTP-binding protein
MSDRPTDPTKLKIVFLGEMRVGKTSIITQFVSGVCPADVQPTVAVAYQTARISVGDTEHELHIWDTAGQELYRSLMPMYCRNVGIAIIVFDVCERKSYEAVEYWAGELRTNCEVRLVIALCGNKIDREGDREVTTDEATELAAQLRMVYVETSAVANVGIDRLFQLAVSTYIATASKAKPDETPLVIRQEKDTKACC